MLGFLATDMYLPAFESIRSELQTSESMIGLTLTVFLLGMAIGQLVFGPLSDKMGRIPVLISGLVLFLIGTTLCYFSQNIETLLIARFIQALGACSATVIWQAVVIDRYEGKAAQRLFASIMPLVALSPAIAPLLGAGIESLWGWRAIFISLIVFGLLLIVFTSKETESAPKIQSNAPFLPRLFSDYKDLLSSKVFFANMLIFSGCSTAFFAWLTGSPFIMSNMGYTGADIGLSFVPQTIAFLIGGYGCRFLLNKLPPSTLITAFVCLFILSASSIFYLCFQNTFTTIWPPLIPFCFLAVANGGLYPLVINRALSPFKHCSATAAGLLNFLQTSLCFVASGVVSHYLSYGLVSVSSVIFVSAGAVSVGFLLGRTTESAPLQVQEENPTT